MCLILLSYIMHPDYRLILAANRDEFYNRPTATLAYWNDYPDVLAGRDLKGNGSWLGVSRSGRIAAITNYRDPTTIKQDAPSRGNLIRDYLIGNSSPQQYLDQVGRIGHHYNGFNLIAGDTNGLFYTSNRSSGVQQLKPGIYGISNHLINSPWPKLQRGKSMLEGQFNGEEKMDIEKIFGILADQSQPDDAELPDTGVGLEWERILSPLFITSPDYGTRCSSIVLFDTSGNITMLERTFIKTADQLKTEKTHQYRFRISH